MDTSMLLTLIVAFVAIVAALEGAWMLWNDTRGPQVRRLRQRVRAISAGGHGQGQAALLKRRLADEGSWLERLTLSLPHSASLDRWIEQAGLETPASRLLGTSLAAGGLTLLAALTVGTPMRLAVACTLGAAALPLLWLAWRRARRLAALRAQLPDAVDLMARSLRAGHALPAALQMVGEESSEPLAEEFRITHDELNFGLGLDEALRNLAARVPGDDMRFLVIAVLLQRETGGNLAQLLTNIAQLVRARMRLLGKVRVLAAEGKFSAWILALMPLVVGMLLAAINPVFMATLWRDPIGVKLIQVCLVLYAVGVLWITRLVRLRV
jgi:tight adherence protein B